jgi:hypothetical protein
VERRIHDDGKMRRIVRVSLSRSLNDSIKRGVAGLQNLPLLSRLRIGESAVSKLAGGKILRDLPQSVLNVLAVEEQCPSAAVDPA